MEGTGGSGSVEGVISLLRSFLAVDFRGVMASAIVGVFGASFRSTSSEGRLRLPSDLAVTLLEAVEGVTGTFASSASAVDALVLIRERALRVPVAVETVEGVGGGGIESRVSFS